MGSKKYKKKRYVDIAVGEDDYAVVDARTYKTLFVGRSLAECMTEIYDKDYVYINDFWS